MLGPFYISKTKQFRKLVVLIYTFNLIKVQIRSEPWTTNLLICTRRFRYADSVGSHCTIISQLLALHLYHCLHSSQENYLCPNLKQTRNVCLQLYISFLRTCYVQLLYHQLPAAVFTDQSVNTFRTGLLNCLNARSQGLTFRHRASCI